MFVKDLVSNHARVKNPWAGIAVIVHIFDAKENHPLVSLSAADAITKYGNYEIREWFCSSHIKRLKQEVEIYILVRKQK